MACVRLSDLLILRPVCIYIYIYICISYQAALAGTDDPEKKKEIEQAWQIIKDPHRKKDVDLKIVHAARCDAPARPPVPPVPPPATPPPNSLDEVPPPDLLHEAPPSDPHIEETSTDKLESKMKTDSDKRFSFKKTTQCSVKIDHASRIFVYKTYPTKECGLLAAQAFGDACRRFLAEFDDLKGPARKAFMKKHGVATHGTVQTQKARCETLAVTEMVSEIEAKITLAVDTWKKAHPSHSKVVPDDATPGWFKATFNGSDSQAVSGLFLGRKSSSGGLGPYISPIYIYMYPFLPTQNII